MSPKETRLVNHLRTYGSITSIEAFELYGETRLSATIFELKKMNVPIEDRDITSTNRYGESVRYREYFVSDRNFNVSPKPKQTKTTVTTASTSKNLF